MIVAVYSGNFLEPPKWRYSARVLTPLEYVLIRKPNSCQPPRFKFAPDAVVLVTTGLLPVLSTAVSRPRSVWGGGRERGVNLTEVFPDSVPPGLWWSPDLPLVSSVPVSELEADEEAWVQRHTRGLVLGDSDRVMPDSEVRSLLILFRMVIFRSHITSLRKKNIVPYCFSAHASWCNYDIDGAFELPRRVGVDLLLARPTIAARRGLF